MRRKRSPPCTVRAGDNGHHYPGTAEVPDGFEGGYLYSAGLVRTTYVVNRAPQSRQGKATGLVAFAEPSADGGALPAMINKKMESAYVEMTTPLVAAAGRRPMRQCQWRAMHKRRSTYMHMASFTDKHVVRNQ